MSKVLRLRRGSTADTATFVGGLAELTIDTTTWTGVIHDNATPGGHRLATEAFVLASRPQTGTSTTAPVNPVTGQLWFEPTSGRLYVYYDSYWVDCNPSMLNNLGNIRMDNTTITTSIGNANLVLSTAGPGTVQVTNRLDVYGGIHGELVGNVTGRHYGPVIGSLDGPVTGDLTGNASGSANTVRAAAQPNITSLGTLTSLTVSTPILADLRGNALTANSAHQADTANTANTANIANTAVTATTATTVLTGYQPNITGVGTLNNLTVSANVVAGGVKTDHYYYANGLPFTGGTGALPPGVSVPGNATEGTFWFDTADGHIYVRYQNSWVDTSVNNSAYTPATPSDWNGTPPATLAAAIDRLAAAVKALRGGTGA